MRRKRSEAGLTELESQVLSIIQRFQPVTAYQVRLAFARSSTERQTLSQGSIYPVVVRLKERGLVVGALSDRSRKTERLECTPVGERIVRGWLFDFSQPLPHDPLSVRFFALPALDEADRKAWVSSAKGAILSKLADIEEAAQAGVGTHHELIHDNARLASLARIRWLERVEARLDAMTTEDSSGMVGEAPADS